LVILEPAQYNYLQRNPFPLPLLYRYALHNASGLLVGFCVRASRFLQVYLLNIFFLDSFRIQLSDNADRNGSSAESR